MEGQGSSNRRIAKNTMYMYVRMFVTMIIGLYTSRLVLSALGFQDYGLYNVIGGVIAMFGFLNAAMVNTTTRYITYYLGKDDNVSLNKVFSTAFYIHVLIAILIIILGETLGLWYVHNKLVIPEGRFSEAVLLYQFTVFTAVVNIISVPFSALIIAHERMSVYAIIAIIDSVFKLGVALLLSYVSFDKLTFYGLMLLLIQIIDNLCYWMYSLRISEGLRIKRVLDFRLFREMFSFTGWNLFGNFSHIFFNQGINLILNFFCGTTVNAARGIAVQVDSIVRQFASNVQAAINPQIIKSYSINDKERFFYLIFTSSRFCFYLLFLLALPIILESDFILTLWLGEFPDHTISFLRITLVTVTLEALVTPMFMANLASGKVKVYQVVMSIISLLFIPLTFFVVKVTSIPETVFICSLVMTIIEIIARIFIVGYQVKLPKWRYVKEVLFKVVIVSTLSICIPISLHGIMLPGLLRFLVVGLASVLSVLIVVYIFGITKEEKKFITEYMRKLTTKFFGHSLVE